MYDIDNLNIKEEYRRKINENIIYLLDNDLLDKYEVTLNDVFNSYTGKGRLHNLVYSDFDNYHEYSKQKKLQEIGQFFTPHKLSRFMVELLNPGIEDTIIDLACGMGNFFNWCPCQETCYGNELDYETYLVSKKLYPQANITNLDMTDYPAGGKKFDFNIGNPPFNLKLKNGELSHWYYIKKSYDLLKPMGIMALIVPDSFLNDDFFHKSKIAELNNMFNHLVTLRLPPNVFNANINTKILILVKKSIHDAQQNQYSDTRNIRLVAVNSLTAKEIHKRYVEPYNRKRIEYRNRVFLDLKKKADTEKDFWYRVDKLLFDISANNKTKKYINKCKTYIDKFLTQEKPDYMTYEKWKHAKITENRVISYLKYYLKKQNYKPIDKIELVKTNYGLKNKAYSNKTQKGLNKKERSFYEMIYTRTYDYKSERFRKLFNKKLKKYDRQSIPFKKIIPDESVIDFMNNFNLPGIQLTDLQCQDISKFLMKDYCINSWGMGGGKSISAVYWIKYKMLIKNICYPMIVSTAKSIYQNWTEKLQKWNIDYKIIKTKQDLSNLKKGEMILFNFNTLIKLNRYIKKFIRSNYKKTLLVIDESHELNNIQAKRTRAAKNCFARMKYKFFMTGTLTLNSIVELYPQLEILYNNSVNMMCECETIYKLDKTGKLELKKNPYYLKPYNAYHGLTTFKNCHNPFKITVFGIKKQTQKILNPEKLNPLLEKTVITRSFKEIAGNKYRINQIRIDQTEEEKRLYKMIMQDFYKLFHYFKKSGNSRKDSMLKIIRQITLLRDSCSIPFKFNEFTGNTFNKSNKIISLIQGKNERWAVGCILKEAVKYYEKQFNKLDRKIFVITGDKTFNSRQRIIKEFEESANGILLSTQQSLSEAIDIPSCQNVIIESLMWNIPRILQYAFRFVRFHSKGITDIYLVNYNNTIEMNMLALLMAKEQINNYIKTYTLKENSDIFKEYNIDMDIYNFMLERSKDEYGKSFIRAS